MFKTTLTIGNGGEYVFFNLVKEGLIFQTMSDEADGAAVYLTADDALEVADLLKKAAAKMQE